MVPPTPTEPVRRRLSELRPETPGRVLMAASGLIVLHLDPPDFSVWPQVMTPLLVAYLVFAVGVLAREFSGHASPRHLDWIDLVWILGLTLVTGGTSSVLFAASPAVTTNSPQPLQPDSIATHCPTIEFS